MGKKVQQNVIMQKNLRILEISGVLFFECFPPKLKNYLI